MKPEKKPAVKFNIMKAVDSLINALFIVGIFSFTTMFVPTFAPTLWSQIAAYGVLTLATGLYIAKEKA